MNGDEVQRALEVLRGTVQNRGDGFDIGGETEYPVQQYDGDQISKMLSNPQELANTLGLSRKQAQNVRSLITGGGAGLSSKYLSQFLGEEIAGALGGFVGGYVSRRLLKK